MSTPNSQNRTPQRMAPGSSARRFNRPNLDTPLENYRREQVDRLENPENGENFNEEAEQAQNENISRQAQRQTIAQQQKQQNKILQTSLRKKAALIKQQAIKSGAQKEMAKKAGGRILVWIASSSGIGCGGCLTYIIIIGAVIAVIAYGAHFLGLV